MADPKELEAVVARLLGAFESHEAAHKTAIAGKDAEIASLTAQLSAVPAPVVTLTPEAQASIDNAVSTLSALADTLEG